MESHPLIASDYVQLASNLRRSEIEALLTVLLETWMPYSAQMSLALIVILSLSNLI